MDERRKKGFGSFIKGLRLKQNLSLRALSEKSDISHSYLSQLELGKRNIPSPEILKKLAISLEVDYFVLARLAGYLEADGKVKDSKAMHVGLDYAAEYDHNIISFEMPAVIKTAVEDGERFDFISPEESKRQFLDLEYLLNSGESIYYKRKLLNSHEKEQILKMLDVLVMDLDLEK